MIVNPVRYGSGNAVTVKTVKLQYGSSAGKTIYGTLNGAKFSTTFKGLDQKTIQLDADTYFWSTARVRSLTGASAVSGVEDMYLVDA